MATTQNQGTFLGTGVCHEEEARAIGHKLFEMYGGLSGELGAVLSRDGVARVLIDAYNTTTIPHQVEEGDIDGMTRILDRNSDGRITVRDIEELAVRILSTNWIPPAALVAQPVPDLRSTQLYQSQAITQSQLIAVAPVVAPVPVPVPVQVAVPPGVLVGRLEAGRTLPQNTPLFSEGGNYFAVVNSSNGLLELYSCALPFQLNQRERYWSSTNARGLPTEPFTLHVLVDANLIIYDREGQPVWSTDLHDTHGHQAAFLVMQADANLVLYAADGKALWASNTVRA